VPQSRVTLSSLRVASRISSSLFSLSILYIRNLFALTYAANLKFYNYLARYEFADQLGPHKVDLNAAQSAKVFKEIDD